LGAPLGHQHTETASHKIIGATAQCAVANIRRNPQRQPYIIEGYTDAKGNKQFNQKLSERRADAVKRFLVAEYRIPSNNLVAVGYGSEHLKNTEDPFSGENRRIRIVNISAELQKCRRAPSSAQFC
jgi:outer membrane protein OmpA-like peptidoglycan-associated protein